MVMVDQQHYYNMILIISNIGYNKKILFDYKIVLISKFNPIQNIKIVFNNRLQ